jgi:MFS family permease
MRKTGENCVGTGKSAIDKLLANNSFMAFLTGQCISCFGDSLRFIAITRLLYKLTGSGLSASLSVCAVIPGIVLSPLAGILGDRISEKKVLITTDLFRSAIVLLLINNTRILSLYMIVIIISSLDAFYSPSLRKLMVDILSPQQILAGNSALSGVTGAANILGLAMAGILVDRHGVELAFLLNSISHAVTALTVLFIKVRRPSSKIMERKPAMPVFADLSAVFGCITKIKPVREIILTGTVISFGGISIALAFYPYAFETIKVTDRQWGYMMSVYYGTSLIAMAVSIQLGKRMPGFKLTAIYSLLVVVSVAWFFYSVASGFTEVMLLQAVEGTALSLAGIIMVTVFQLAVPRDYMARASGINDLFNSVGKVAAIGLTYILLSKYTVRQIFIVNSVILFAYSIYMLINSYKKGPPSHFHAS